MAIATTTALAIAGLAISAGGTVYGMVEKQKQADLMRKQSDEANKRALIEKRMAEMKDAQAKRDVLRRQRILAGQMANQAALSGTSGSSGAIGGLDALAMDTQRQIGDLNSGAGAQDTMFASSVTSAQYGRAAGESAGRADIASGVAAVGGSVFDAAGGYKSIFDAGQGGGSAPQQWSANDWTVG